MVRTDGSVVSVRQGRGGVYWDSRHKRWVSGGLAGLALDPGDTIIVPERLERVAGMRLARDITQILYQIAVATGVVMMAF